LATVIASQPSELLDLFALAEARGITLGIAWLLVQMTKAIVPSVVDYLSRRRLLQTIEQLAASAPSARIQVTSQGFVFDPAPVPFQRADQDQLGYPSGQCADQARSEHLTFGTIIRIAR
jgi:hypothetical protein